METSYEREGFDLVLERYLGISNSPHAELAVHEGRIVFYRDGFMRVYTAKAEKVEWIGEGLPPVGTVCEFAGGTACPEDPFDRDLKEGMKVAIIAHFKCGDFTLAAFTFDPENQDRGMLQVEQANFGCFRPIRTPEQIAAEEREKSVLAAMESTASLGISDSSKRILIERLYDAGLLVDAKP